MAIVNEPEYLVAMGLESTATQADRALLALLSSPVEQAVAKVCGNGFAVDIEQTSRTFLLPQHSDRFVNDPTIDIVGDRVIEARFRGSSRRLQVPAIALRSVSDLREDTSGAFGSDTALTEGRSNDFYIDETESGLSRTAMLIRVGTTWPSGRRTVQVACSVGFSASELAGRFSDIKLAVIETMLKTFNEFRAHQQSSAGAAGPIISRRIGDAAWTYSESAMKTLTGLEVRVPSSARRKLAPYMLYEYL